MKVYFAPLEGVTDAIFRRTHSERFPGVEKYFIPFLSPTKELNYGKRTWYEIAPENNAGIYAVPQILTNSVDAFVYTAQMLAERGFKEVNLNVGCPSGTVTAKGKGSGLLRDPEGLQRLLDGIFARSPLPVSVKTRIGFADTSEWERIRCIYAQYPMLECIVHPRTRRQFYAGQVEASIWTKEHVCNGDLFTAKQALGVPSDTVMLGRGLIANPALARELQGGEPLKKEELIAFHDRLLRAYTEAWPEKAVPGHMHEISSYFLCCLEVDRQQVKRIRKANALNEYTDEMARAFDTCPMKAQPAFTPPEPAVSF